jgi:hypothetical protein
MRPIETRESPIRRSRSQPSALNLAHSLRGQFLAQTGPTPIPSTDSASAFAEEVISGEPDFFVESARGLVTALLLRHWRDQADGFFRVRGASAYERNERKQR